MNILFWIICGLYFLVATKVDEWITISVLGFETETPQRFLEKPYLYKGVSTTLFFVLIVLLFFIDFKVIGGALIILFWFFSGYIGHHRAYYVYRKVIKEMIEYTEDENKKNELREALSKDDSALLDKILERTL